MRYGGLNHLKYIEKVKGRMDVLHVKDFTLATDLLGNVLRSPAHFLQLVG